MLHESDGMRARRRRDTGNKTAARLPDTIARLVQFTIMTRTRGGCSPTSTSPSPPPYNASKRPAQIWTPD